MKHLTPREIEAESMRIIDKEAGAHPFPEQEWQIVRRIIHATADFEYIKTVRFHNNAVSNGINALRQGCPVYTDTAMLAAAVTAALHKRWKCRVLCYIADEEIREESKKTGETRSVLALRKAIPFLQSGIIAIGNAPTALQEALSLSKKKIIKPDLIIGLPVGFVGALESKEHLFGSGLSCITNLGRKGGTPATAAALNALSRCAESR